MVTPLIEMEGTWKEITAQVPDFGERRLHVVVFSADENETDQPRRDPRWAILEEIESRCLTMNPRADTHDYLREARAGAMFGYDPCE